MHPLSDRISAKELARRLGYRSVKSINRAVTAKRLPEPSQIGRRCRRTWYWPDIKKLVGLTDAE